MIQFEIDLHPFTIQIAPHCAEHNPLRPNQDFVLKPRPGLDEDPTKLAGLVLNSFEYYGNKTNGKIAKLRAERVVEDKLNRGGHIADKGLFLAFKNSSYPGDGSRFYFFIRPAFSLPLLRAGPRIRTRVMYSGRFAQKPWLVWGKIALNI